ncbi:Hypothetical predicted protein [Cloeon dipterum]|uniref:Peptidase C14 caspase domain-containing protein n=1 Tax=Cloeon dipterum TaxID=197152 RepID=A0A8S1D2V4_9INSE|nr:Hypothetical predicted protein [Cloeon dipterum]
MDADRYFAFCLFTASKKYAILPSSYFKPSPGVKVSTPGICSVTLGEEYQNAVFQSTWCEKLEVESKTGKFLDENFKIDADFEHSLNEAADYCYCFVLATAPSVQELQNFIQNEGRHMIKTPEILKRQRDFVTGGEKDDEPKENPQLVIEAKNGKRKKTKDTERTGKKASSSKLDKKSTKRKRGSGHDSDGNDEDGPSCSKNLKEKLNSSKKSRADAHAGEESEAAGNLQRGSTRGSMEEILNRGNQVGRPEGPASLGYFENPSDSLIEKQNADSVFVLVAHYEFKNDSQRRRVGDSKDVKKLKTFFRTNRNCNFRELSSPSKEDLLELLSDKEKLLHFFSSTDLPDVFTIFVLSHGNENGLIYTDIYSTEDQNKLVHFTTDDVFDSIQKISGFDKCLKLINFGPCRGVLDDAKFDANKEYKNYENRNSCRITMHPAIRNLVVFYSTVETTLANTDEYGSWFVRGFCVCLNLTCEKSLVRFYTAVQSNIHNASRARMKFQTGEPLGQTPEVKIFAQERNFVFSKPLKTSDPDSRTDAVKAKSASITYSEFFTWKSDEQKNIRGRRAYIFSNSKQGAAQEMEKALRQNLNFVTKTWKLSKTALGCYFKEVSDLERDVGCVMTCIYGQVCENEGKEACVLVDGKEFPVADILHAFVGPKNDSLIGKPKVLFIVDQEAQGNDSISAEECKYSISATNHSGWLVLILKDQEASNMLLKIFQGDELKRGKCLQDLLVPTLISKNEGQGDKILFDSTLQYLLDFPNWPISFVQPHFRLKIGLKSLAKIINFNKLVRRATKSVEKFEILLLSSEAGAGKTTVLKEIASHLEKSNSEIKILLVFLKKHSLYISKMRKMKEIEFLAETTHNTLDDIKSWIENMTAVVFLDGFDEICPDHRDKVLSLVKVLTEQDISLWIGTRPHEAGYIKNVAKNAVHVGIEPLNRAKQIEFLQTVEGKSEEESKRFLNRFEKKGILKNPLHLSLLAQNDGEENLYLLYDQVVRKKVEMCLVRQNGYKDVAEENIEKALDFLRLIAFRFMKGEDLQVDIKDLEKMNELGVATVLNGEVIFLHQTFAEFLATQQFVKEVEVLDTALFEQNNLSQCRKFLDYYYPTLKKREEINEHRKALLTTAKSVDHKIFMMQIAEENLRHIFDIVKTHISFKEEEVRAPIRMKPFPELFIRAIGSEQIVTELVGMGVIDFPSLKQILPEVLREIEEYNATKLFEKLISNFPHFLKEIYENQTHLSLNCNVKLGFTAAQRDYGELLHYWLIRYGICSINDLDENENIFYRACKHGSVTCVDVLLKCGAKKVVCGVTSYDPLTLAVEYGHLDLVKYLLEEKYSGYKRDNVTFVIEGSTEMWNPFQYAILYGRREIAAYLLSKSPTLRDVKTKDGMSPLQLAVVLRKGEMFVWLAKEANADYSFLMPSKEQMYMMEYDCSNYEHFLMLEGDVTKKYNKGKTVLHYAAQYGYSELVLKYIELGADIGAKDENGWNAQHFACHWKRSIETIELLHSKNPLLLIERTKRGQTTLHILVENCSKFAFGSAIENALGVARFLIEEGEVNMNASDNRKITASRIAHVKGLDKILKSCLTTGYYDPFLEDEQREKPNLHFSTNPGDLEALQKWIELGGDLDMRDKLGRTALHLVTEGGKLEFLHKKTIDSEDSLEATDKNRGTALLRVCRSKNWSMVDKLLTINVDLNKKDREGKTALHHAVCSEKLDLVQKLVGLGADVNCTDRSGSTSLLYATYRNNLDLVQLLALSGAHINLENNYGSTALHLAVKRNDQELLQKLCDLGADVNFKNRNGITALHLAVGQNNLGMVQKLLKLGANAHLKNNYGGTPFRIAVENINSDLVLRQFNYGGINRTRPRNTSLVLIQNLLDHCSDINSKIKGSWSALHIAVRNNNFELVQTLFYHGADVNVTTKKGITALHLAVQMGHSDMTQKLLECSANVNVQNHRGWTALHVAARKENFELVQKLIDYDAQINLRTEKGYTALHHAVVKGSSCVVRKLLKHGADVNIKNKDGHSNMIIAARKIYQPEVVQELIDHGAEINFGSVRHGFGALHLSVSTGKLEFVLKLLDNGADVDLKNKKGVSALHIAASKNHPEILRTLLQGGANVNAQSKTGNTALHDAVRKGNLECVQILIVSGANVHLQDKKGMNALHFAVSENNLQLVQMLLEQGAKPTAKNNFGENLFHRAVKYNNLKMALMLYKKDPNLIKQVNRDGETSLHLAIEYFDDSTADSFELILFLVEKVGIDVNMTQISGRNALLYACKYKKWPVVDYLLTKNVDVNKVDRKGKTAIHYAVLSGEMKIVQQLVKHGADLSGKIIENGYNLVHIAARQKNSKMISFLHGKNQELVKQVTNERSTPLHIATRHSSVEVIRWLLNDIKVDVNAVDSFGSTVFMVACKNNKLQIINLLLAKNVDVNKRKLNGKHALHFAAASGNLDLVETLLRQGADPALKCNEGMNSIHFAIKHVNVVFYLHEFNGGLVKEVMNNGNTCLHLALGKNTYSFEVVKWLIEEMQLDVNSPNLKGVTPFMIACENNCSEAIQLLLSKGVEVNKTDQDGKTALHYAVKSGCVSLVQKLLDNGADLTVKANSSKTVLHFGFTNIEMTLFLHQKNGKLVKEKLKYSNTALILAISSRKKVDEKVMHWLIEDAGINLDALSSYGDSALLRACEYKKWDVVEILLTKNVDISIKNSDGKSALHYAAESGKLEIVQTLLERGADWTVKDSEGKNVLHNALEHIDVVFILHDLNEELVRELTEDKSNSLHLAIAKSEYSFEVIRWLVEEIDFDVDSTNEKGETALMIASMKNRLDVVHFLLDKNADVSKRNQKGQTALHHAVKSGSLELVKSLLDHGADLESKDNDGRNVLHFGLGNLEMVLFLNEKNGELARGVDNLGNTSLIVAVDSDGNVNEKVISWLVEESGINLNALNLNGESAFLIACKRKNWKVVNIMLTKDVAVNANDPEGKTTLHYAAESGKLEIVQTLLERGAELNSKDSSGLNVLHFALGHIETVLYLHNLNNELVKDISKDKNSSLHLAITRGSKEVINWLLDEIKLDLNESNESGETPLLLACRTENWAVVDLLLDKNAIVSKQDRDGNTALQYATNFKRSELMVRLELLNQTPELDGNAT